jgi:hypothetical protein
MGLAADMQPHIRNALLEVPPAFRDEVSDALSNYYDFEGWRLNQDPAVDDTPANRADYVSLMMAHATVSRIRGVVREARAAAANASIDSDLGV